MRICILSSADFNKTYGSTNRPYYTSKYLAKFGCEILHICQNSPDNPENKIQYMQKKNCRDRLWVIRTLRDLHRIYKGIEKFSPDVLYVHQTSNAMRGLSLKYFNEIPVVFDAHGSAVLEYTESGKISHKIISIQEKKVLEKSDRVVVVSEELKNFFLEYFDIPPEKLELIYNGVDTNIIKPMKPDQNLKKDLGISNKDKVVVFICPRTFLSNLMALDYFFKMVPEIERYCESIKFLIIGGGSEIKPPSPNVIYTGFVKDLNSYINLGDVCVAPYPPAAVCGGTRNKLADYFACGKPVVSTEEGMRGFADAKPNRDFLLAKNDDDFIEKISIALTNEKIARKLSTNSRKLAFKYDWGKLTKDLIGLLEEYC